MINGDNHLLGHQPPFPPDRIIAGLRLVLDHDEILWSVRPRFRQGRPCLVTWMDSLLVNGQSSFTLPPLASLKFLT
jgi:hypothetical protein